MFYKKGIELKSSKNAADLQSYASGDITANIEVADLTSKLGKESAKNKALHQKENESKDKK